MYVCMYVCMYNVTYIHSYIHTYCDECVCMFVATMFYRLSINKFARRKRASMEKLAIHLKYINSRVTSFFDVLGKANHRLYCADEVILTRSDDLVQPSIG
jgi:hypothetical protein